MTDVIFRLNEQELDRMLGEARAELEKRRVTIADGSARDALVWATSFSLERRIGSDTHRVATTITLNDDAPLSVQSVGIAPRLTYRIPPSPLHWSELRRRGMAEMVIEHLGNAAGALQVRIGVDFAYEEFARRCERLRDLIGDDVPNAAALREMVASWRDQATARTLYSRAKPELITDVAYGHLDDDVLSLNEFYANNIFKPLSAAPPTLVAPPIIEERAPEPKPVGEEHSRRPAILDRLPEAAATAQSGEPVNVVGIILLISAVLAIAVAAWLHSLPVAIGGGIFLLLVLRAMWQWRG